MIRMSDILKKIRERKKETQKPAVEPTPPETIPHPPAPPLPEQKVPSKPEPALSEERKISHGDKTSYTQEKSKEEPKMPEVRISPVIKETKVASNEETLKLYDETLSLIRELLKEKDIDYKSIDTKRLTIQTEKIVEQLMLDNEEISMLALISNPTDTHTSYLYHHLVNTTIFSIIIGKALGYERERLIKLGISSSLYDIDMSRHQDLTKLPRKLTIEEYSEIKNHVREGVEILEKVVNLSKMTIEAAYQHHERIDGSGYPQGLKEEDMNEFAKIITFADVYEALTHYRAHRKAYSPLEAIKIILKNKNTFDTKIVKSFLEKMGLYPVGSLVELNTGEIAKVIKHNPKHALAPKVMVVSVSRDGEIGSSREIDLSANLTIYITKCFSCDERG